MLLVLSLRKVPNFNQCLSCTLWEGTNMAFFSTKTPFRPRQLPLLARAQCLFITNQLSCPTVLQQWTPSRFGRGYAARRPQLGSPWNSSTSKPLLTSFPDYSSCKFAPIFLQGYPQSRRSYAKGANKGKGKSKKNPNVDLSEEQLTEVVNVPQMKEKMEHALEKLRKDYAETLTLRTTPGVLDNLSVHTPDGDFALNQLGQVVQKNPQLIVIDMTALPQYTSAVRKTIENSAMNLNPQQEGTSIFVPLPKVTHETREQLAKNAKILCDRKKASIREIQNDYIKGLRKAKLGHTASESLINNLDSFVHSTASDIIQKADEMLKKKQNELLDMK